MMGWDTTDINNLRMVQYGLVHGGVINCESNQYPNIYNRLDSPLILTWLRENIFNGKSDFVHASHCSTYFNSSTIHV